MNFSGYHKYLEKKRTFDSTMSSLFANSPPYIKVLWDVDLQKIEKGVVQYYI